MAQQVLLFLPSASALVCVLVIIIWKTSYCNQAIDMARKITSGGQWGGRMNCWHADCLVKTLLGFTFQPSENEIGKLHPLRKVHPYCPFAIKIIYFHFIHLNSSKESSPKLFKSTELWTKIMVTDQMGSLSLILKFLYNVEPQNV